MVAKADGAPLAKSELDFGTLSIGNLIAHEIPRRMKADKLATIPLSEAVPPMPAETLDFFTQRLKGTLLKRGQLIEVDPRLEDPPIPNAMKNWFDSKAPGLVEFSQTVARHLYSVQYGSTSEGLLAASGATFCGRDALALMKLPHENGLQIKHTVIQGKATFTVEVLGNLTLTENTRVFKAGIFWKGGDGELAGIVSDDQINESSEIAGFFLTDFLGFRLQQQPKVLTKTFRKVVRDFINKNVEDEDLKLDYFQALGAELQSNGGKIDPPNFVQQHFAAEYKAPLLKLLKEHGVPSAAFAKDLSSLPRRGRKTRITTDGGLTISGDAEAVGRIEAREIDGEKVIVIHDSLKSVE